MLADVSKPRTHTFIINNLKHFKVLSRMDFPVAMVTPSQVQSSSLLTLFRLATLQKKNTNRLLPVSVNCRQSCFRGAKTFVLSDLSILF